MQPELKKIRKFFLAEDVDDEDRDDNIKLLEEWEISLRRNEAMLEWQNHDVTKDIVKIMRTEYKNNAFMLGTNEKLTEAQRSELWQKQKAISFILSVATSDSRGEIKSLQDTIKKMAAQT